MRTALFEMRDISIHAPHEGERLALQKAIHHYTSLFQSTLPTRGSDDDTGRAGPGSKNFNPRSPRGGATDCRQPSSRKRGISIHAPHEGERHSCSTMHKIHSKISIHAPHEGERQLFSLNNLSHKHFNPRSPRGGATLIG